MIIMISSLDLEYIRVSVDQNHGASSVVLLFSWQKTLLYSASLVSLIGMQLN